MLITATVMAHPKRKAQAEALAIELKMYPFIDVSITWDTQNNEWHTGERALRQGIRRGEWHLVIQDDAVLTPRFYVNIEGAISTLSTKALISLYVGRVRPFGRRVQEAVDKATHATWLRHYMLFWGVAFLIPSDHIEPMLDFVNENRLSDTPYDVRIGIFYQRNMMPVYYTMPSLVDHHEALGSLLDHDSSDMPRVAHKLATGLVEWNKDVIDI